MVLAATLLGGAGGPARWCLACGDTAATDAVLNTLLFVPLGAALAARGRGAARAALLSLALSLGVEALQSVLPLGRTVSLSDLATNSLGGWLGAAGWRARATLVAPARALARRLAVAALAAWLALQGLGTLVVTPSRPATTYFGQWAADLGHLARFDGEPRRVTVDGVPLAGRALAADDPARHALGSRAFTLQAATTPGTTRPGLAPIASVFDGESREVVLLGRFGDALAFRPRTRAADWRLRPVGVTLAMDWTRDTLVAVTGAVASDGAWHLEGPEAARRVIPEAGWLWATLLPFGPTLLPPWAAAVTALWLAALLAPAGYWSGRGRVRQPAAAGVTAAALGIGLAAMPLAAGLPPAPPLSWIGAGAGALLAHALGTAARRSESSA